MVDDSIDPLGAIIIPAFPIKLDNPSFKSHEYQAWTHVHAYYVLPNFVRLCISPPMHGIPQPHMILQLLPLLLLQCTVEVTALDDLKSVVDFSIKTPQNLTKNEFGHFVPKCKKLWLCYQVHQQRETFFRSKFWHSYVTVDPTKYKYIEPNYHIGSGGVYTPLAALSKHTPAAAQSTRPRKTSNLKVRSTSKHSSKTKFELLSAQISATETDLLWPDATIFFKWHKGISCQLKSFAVYLFCSRKYSYPSQPSCH